MRTCSFQMRALALAARSGEMTSAGGLVLFRRSLIHLSSEKRNGQAHHILVPRRFLLNVEPPFQHVVEKYV
jgi:hypothetical protein